MTYHRTYGIIPSDVVIRAAIVQGLRELRANPWLLDYCFSWLLYDDLTSLEYGQKEIEEAKKWFLTTEIDVRMAALHDQPSFPMINIMLSESVEDVSSLGDVHYDPISEAEPFLVGQKADVVHGPFSPTSYDSSTGIVTIPLSFKAAGQIKEGQTFFDTHNNTGYLIEEVLSSTSFRIQPGCLGDFRNATIIPRFTSRLVHLESLVFRETYTLGVHASKHQRYTLYLHSILVFILLRWKEAYLEGRGFERSTVASGPLAENEYFSGGPEVVFSRTVQTTGYVRHYWPKLITKPMDDLEVSVSDEGGNLLSSTYCSPLGFCGDDQPF